MPNIEVWDGAACFTREGYPQEYIDKFLAFQTCTLDNGCADFWYDQKLDREREAMSTLYAIN